MNLLSELRDQVQSQKEDDDRRKKESGPTTDVLPKMQAIAAYLRELAEHLNYLKPKIYAEYNVEGIGEIKDLLQSDYHIGEFQDQMRSFSLSFVCSKEKTYHVKKDKLEDIERLGDYLRSHNLRYGLQEFRNDEHRLESARFSFKPQVDVIILFEAKQENSTIDISFNNYFSLGLTRLNFKAEMVNEEFMNDLGSALLRRNNNLLEYQKFFLSDEAKEELRQKIRAEEMHRDAEIRMMEQVHKEEKEETEKKRSVSTVLGRLVNDMKAQKLGKG